MRLKSIKPLHILLTLTLLISLVPVFHIVVAQAKPKIFVDPADNIFYTDETSVGATFDVSVKSADFADPGVYSYEFRLYYDTSMLVATAAAIPDGHWLTPTLSPGNIFKVDPGTINTAEGYVSFAATLLGAEPGKTGGGTIATITLQITAAPPAAGSLSSKIELKEVTLVDPDATPIPAANFDIVPATFTFAAPPPPWYLKVVPELSAASAVGDRVVIEVDFLNVKREANISSIQFSLLYPGVLRINAEDIVEGDLFKAAGETFFIGANDTIEDGQPSVTVGIQLIPDETGQITNFPDGNGSLAIMTFRVQARPPTMTTFPLTLTNVIILDNNVNPVPYRRLEDGALLLPTKLEDLNGDGKVNIQDLAIFALAFGSTSTSDRWNPKADVNRDGKVNIMDGVMIAKSFGFGV
jgi:hypothetical protein